jgi:glycosyltransferase involved in cell wall biosynthesis
MDGQAPVLWLHSHFLLPMGGTKFVYEVVRRLAQRRPVEVVVEAASDLYRERYAQAGVPLREIGTPTSTSMSYWAALPAFLARDVRAVGWAARGKGAIVSSFFPMNWIGTRIAGRTGIRHVHLAFEPFPFFHDREVIDLYPPPKRALLTYLRAAYGGLDRGGVRGADARLTLNGATAGALERVYGVTDATPTYAGVDSDTFHPYSDDELADLRERHGEGPFAIHSTDYSPIKRTDLALRAFAAAASKVPSAKLLITSTREDPSVLADLRAQADGLGIGDRVEFLGFLPFADLPRYYSLANVMLQTATAANSGATTMALPVKEALACGTPALRPASTDEDVEDGVSGYLVDPEDPAAFGARAAELLRDRERSRQFGEAGRQRVVELYRWDRVVDIVEAAIG